MNKIYRKGLVFSFSCAFLLLDISIGNAQDTKKININSSAFPTKCVDDPEAVEDKFDKAIEVQPNFAKAYNDRGEAKIKLGDCNGALEDFDRAIELMPLAYGAYDKAFSNRGNVKLQQGKYEEAIVDYQKSYTGDSYGGQAVAKIKIKLQEIESSAREKISCGSLNSEVILKSDDTNERKRNMNALVMACLYNNPEYHQERVEIIEKLNQAVELGTINPEVYYYRGLFRLKEDYQEMGDEYDGVRPEISNPETFYVSSKAIQDFSKAIELDPDQINSYEIRGDIFFKNLNFLKAVLDWNKVVAAEPENHNIYIRIGDAKLCQGLVKEALIDFQNAIELNPNYGYAYLQRGFIKLLLGDEAGANLDYNTGFELSQDSYADQKLLASRNYTKMYFMIALAPTDVVGSNERFLALSQAILIDPNNPYAYYERSLIRDGIGDKEGAKQDFQKAKKLIKTYVNIVELYDGDLHNVSEIRKKLGMKK